MKRYTTVLLAFASCLSFNPLKAAVPENAKMAIVDFRQVAKAAIPAVVSIQVSGNGDGVASSQTYNPEQFSKDPFGAAFLASPMPEAIHRAKITRIQVLKKSLAKRLDF